MTAQVEEIVVRMLLHTFIGPMGESCRHLQAYGNPTTELS